jgi:N-hydroxyarylamine O-acetyltransferase
VTPIDVDGYLARLGFDDERPGAGIDTLRDLMARHLERVPFENAGVLRGEAIVLDPTALVARLVGRRRGGFCYQLNGAFAALLGELGYAVDLLAARFHSGEGMEPRFGHLAMRVRLDDVDWLVDVGGGYSFRQPLRIVVDEEQDDPAGRFRLVRAAVTAPEEGDAIDVEWRHRDGSWRPHYRFESAARRLADFATTCEWTRTSPKSPFTHGWICAVATPRGWATLDSRRFRLTGAGEPDEDRELTADADLTEALDRWFGVPPA